VRTAGDMQFDSELPLICVVPAPANARSSRRNLSIYIARLFNQNKQMARA